MAALLATGMRSSGGGSSSSTASGPVTLTIWHNYGTEQNATALKNLAAAFHKLHPNVTVNVVSQPADNYFALLQAAAVSKTGPDLAVMWTGLFTLQYKSFLTNLQGQGPGRRAGADRPRRAQVDLGRLQPGQRAVRDPAGEPVLHRLLQQGRLRQGRGHLGADRLEPAVRRVHEAEGGRVHSR